MNKDTIVSFQQLEYEYKRCLGCPKAPCLEACPLHVSPKEFIDSAKKHNYSDAVNSIYEKNPLGLVCGLVCPDKFCMKVCTRCKIDGAVKIPVIQAALIQQYGMDFSSGNKIKSNGIKVAVIGSGPAGIGATWKLLQLGYQVELFEAGDKIGGSLNLIPEERLARKAIDYDYQRVLQSNNFVLHLNATIKKIEELLLQGFSGVIVAIGTQEVNNLNIEGEEYIVSYVDYLSNSAKYAFASKVAIIGGGKVAADCAFVAHKHKAKTIHMLIRRNVTDMRMSEAEKNELQSYDVEFKSLTKVAKVSKYFKNYICCLSKTQIVNGKCEDNYDTPLIEEDYDLVIKAIGGSRIVIPENSRIICAGDCKNGATTVVEAVASGVDAALKLNHFLDK